MAGIGMGYGSECHLLRCLGRHRNWFDKKVCKKIGADSVNWLDFRFDPTRPWKDAELRGLEFLPENHPILVPWSEFWPRRGNSPNWDAVGKVKFNEGDEYLFVEAKAHIEELFSDCKAKEEGGRAAIKKALEDTKNALGVSSDRDWLNHYYQYANRLTILNFLNKHGVKARLLLVYFLGDSFSPEPSKKFTCPRDEAEWNSALQEQDDYLGLGQSHNLSNYIHKLFVPVAGD